MAEIRAKFISRIQRTRNVFSFRFVPSAQIDFLPGQFTQVIFNERDLKNKLLNKYLSYSSAPGKPYFEVTKKMSESDFSKRLLALKEGDEVLSRPAMGRCIFDPGMDSLGFLIGGIGITPVISILEYIAGKKLPTDVRLLYSNWSVRDIAFRAELDAWAGECPNIKVDYILADCRPEDTGCFSGTITNEFIAARLPDIGRRHIFIFGPPGMVKAMDEICRCAGCAFDKVKVENFTGY